MSSKIITFVGRNFIVMKKALLIISLLTIVVVGANAQTKMSKFGFKVGPTFDWASSGSTAANYEGIRIGFNLGFVYDHYLSNNIAVSSGVSCNFLRMKYSFTDVRRIDDFLEEANVMVNRRLKATNIEIPIKLKVKLDVVDSFNAYVEAGGGLSFNCKDFGKDAYCFKWVSYEDQSYVNCTNQYRPLQLSMIFGLGTEYEINRNLSAFVQLTFDHAFSNVFNSSLVKQTGSILRNNYIGIEAGIMF